MSTVIVMTLSQRFPRHVLCVCKQLRNDAPIFKSFVCFDLARRTIIHSMRVRLQEYLLVWMSALMSDHVFIRA